MPNPNRFRYLLLLLALFALRLVPGAAPPAPTARAHEEDFEISLPVILRTRPTRFAVIGDFGDAGQPAADVAALVRSWDPEFIVTTGDNNYPDGEAATIPANITQYYGAYILSSGLEVSLGPQGGETNRFYPSLGNHDWHSIQCAGSVCTGPHFDYFQLPGNERYYDFVWGSVHIYILNSHGQEPAGNEWDSAQGSWLQGRLAESRSPWDIVVFHFPPYSSGARHGSIEVMRWPFEGWGAEGVLSGHAHVYERLQVGGIPYFINGLGGRSIYEFGPPLPESQVRFNGDYGALLVEATHTAITYQFYTRTGVLVDEFTVEK